MTITPDRPTRPALIKGWRRQCPRCGKGAMFSGYLTVAPTCTVCGQELFHHRADDGPAYLTILIVGHLVGFAIHIVWVQFRPEPLVMATAISLMAIILSLWLLPRLKGAIVALQWANRMHGFGGSR